MKKAIKTLFQPQSLKMTLMVVFAWCCLGLPSAFAQIVITDDGETTHTSDENHATVDCDATTTTTFTDDGGVTGNYADATARMDTVEICPMDPDKRITVTFTDFDIAPNDTLFAFDGNIDSVRTSAAMIGIGSGSGVGPSNFCSFDRIDGAGNPGTGNGKGWVTASCSPILNPSGCITFIFETDGMNTKGSGWVAEVSCEDRSTEIGDVALNDVALTCAQGTALLTIPGPPVITCGETLLGPNNVVDFVITNSSGDECISGQVSQNGSAPGAPDWVGVELGVGQYQVKYTWPLDETVMLTKLISITEPSLVCNDGIEASFGAAGFIEFTPDDLLENPCDTISGDMYYNISIVLGSGKDADTLRTLNFDNDGAVVYPAITKEAVAAAGLDCNGTATIIIERIYYGLGFPAPSGRQQCDNGVVNASCETTITFADQSAPVLSPPAGLVSITACDIETVEDVINSQIVPFIEVVDNFDADVDVTVEVELDESGPCFGDDGTTMANVTFTATDDCNNSTSITIGYPVLRPTVLEKVADFSVECNEVSDIPVPSMTIGYTNGSGFQRTDAVPLNAVEALDTGADPADYICGYVLLYTEEEIPTTDCGSKTYRYYDLVDWCASTGGPQRVDTVFAEFTDETPPTFVGEVSDRVIAPADINLGAFDCTYDINQHVAPAATDNCDGNVNANVTLNKVFRIEDGTNWEITDQAEWANLDCDSFRLMYVVGDACHEQTLQDTTRQIVVIKDVTAPTVVAIDDLNVSVPNDEGAIVLVDAIDSGSSDACGIQTREVRRENPDGSYSDWGASVVITCEDVHEDVTVELRVTDNKGNVNFDESTIKAEDKIPPVCEDLGDVILTCKDINTGELGDATNGEWVPLEGALLAVYNSRFGAPNCTDNLTCGDLTFEQEYQLTELGCGELTARRRYRAFDWQGTNGNPSGWAEQNITVTYVPEWTIAFPADLDLTVNCGDDAPVPAPLNPSDVILNGSCDLWALSLISEDTFTVGNDVCMRIERKYEVINWCRFNAGEAATPLPHNVDGADVSHTDANVSNNYTYTHFINVTINDEPTIEFGDVNTCIVGVGDALPFNEEDQFLGVEAYECDTIRTFSAIAKNCIGVELTDITWQMFVDDVRAGGDTGDEFTWVVQPGVSYRVEFSASDGCGNSVSDSQIYVFSDCKKPTPYVLNGIAVDLGEDGTVEVWANDLDLGSFDNCTDQADLEMFITIGELTDIADNVDDIRALGSNVEFTCDHIGRTNVLIYVVDASGNFDVVGTFVSVGGNAADCAGSADPGGMVAGHIVTPLGENVEQVVVSVAGAMQESMMTTADGTFEFQLNTGDDYTVTPVKDMNPLNGVSTFDLVLISKHILGITPFDSPYKFVAADVNKSGTVTAFDMVQVRQLILNIRTEFPQNDSWRFVDASHDFAASTTNPAAQNFAEFKDINQLSQSMMDIDFIGVKVGDINGNAAANSLLGAESRTTNGSLTFNVADRFVEAGETVTVDFTSANIDAAQGYQFTMNFTGLTFDKLGEGVAKAANFNTDLAERGVIATSWNGEATAEDALFSLTFNATTSGLLSDLMTVSSDLTAAEAYNTDGELLDVNIEFSAAVAAQGFELGQNTPNPFNGETVIGFNLPNAGSATLTVMNIQGKVLKEIKGDYAKGYNTIVLKASDLATGVLHYQLESADHVATKKMIIID